MKGQFRGLAGPITKLVIFAVVTIVMTTFLAATISSLGFSSGKKYKAVFEDASMIDTGDDVRIAGVPVGEVTAVDVVDRNRARVTFSVDRDGDLPASTRAEIKYRNLIGQRYLALEQGTGEQGGVLHSGDTIPVGQTTPALNLTELFNGFRPLFSLLEPEDVNQLAFSIIEVFQGQTATMTDLVATTSSLAGTVADKDEVIGEVIENLSLVLDTVNERSEEFDQMIVNTSDLVGRLSAERDTIGQATSSLADLTDATADLLGPIRPDLQGTIAATRDLSANLDAHRDDVEHLLTTLPEKYEALNRTAQYGSWFQFYVCGIDVIAGAGQSSTLNLPEMPEFNVPLYTNIAPRCHANGGE